VIWLSEEPPSALREKLERFGLADLDDDQLRFKHRVDVRGRPDLSAIIEEVRHEAARTGAKVVIVDTLGFWGALPKEAENDAGAMREVMTYFTELASYGLAVIVVHHMSKLGEARGSTAIVANVDIALEMKREGEHDRRRKLEGIGRYEATPRSLIIELTEADDYRVLGIPAQISHKDREATVYDALPDSGHGLTQDDIAQMTTITRQRVGDALQALIMRGSVLRLGSGKKGDPFRYRQVAGPAQQFVSATTRGVGGGNTAEMAETEMEVF
jgi:hypothetical protein